MSTQELLNGKCTPALEQLFRPETIAIAGASAEPRGTSIGNSFIKRIEDMGFKGRIYAVNPSGGEVGGRRIYPSLLDIPEPVDFVISAIPAKHTPQLISDCAEKGVKLVHLFSAGFSELGNETGVALESEVVQIARDAGVRLTGPNGMGIYSPGTGLAFDEAFSRKPGNVGWLAQSGRNGIYIVRDALLRGVYFSKAISYGNGADLNESDFIDYFSDDPETDIIAAYIEGVKDGRRFFRILKEAAAKKPVIILKGGNTEAGSRGVASHTASIAGSDAVWSAVCKQAGAIRVNSLEGLADLLPVFNFLQPPKGRRVSIVGFGGGAGVLAADICTDNGMSVPASPPELQVKLRDMCGGDAGSIFMNPFDLWAGAGTNGISGALEAIAGWDKTDLLLVHIQFDLNPSIREMVYKPYVSTLTRLASKLNYRTAVVLDFVVTAEAKKLAIDVQSTLAEAGYAVFMSITGAATALGRFIDYHERDRS